MGASIQPQTPDVGKTVAALRAQGADDDTVHRYLTEHMGLQEVGGATPDPMAKFHADYKSGKLQQRVARANTNDAEAVAAQPGILETLGQAPETFAAGVPGGKLLISGGRKLLNPSTPLADIQKDVNTETSDVPYASAFGRAAGMLAALRVLPASGAASGAIAGGADQALNNDPNSKGLGWGRVGRTVAGAAGGGLLGKITDMAAAGGRALFSPGTEAAKDALTATRGNAAGDSYTSALAEGRGKAMTPELQAVLSKPDIADAAQRTLSLAQHEGKAINDPDVLHDIFKTLSDHQKGLEKGMAQMDPSKPNNLAALSQHYGILKEQLLAALRGTPQAPGPMPSYPGAVEEYAANSGRLGAMEKGYESMRSGMSGNLPAFKNVGKKDEGGLASYLADSSQPEVEGRDAATGILGAIRDAVKARKPLASLTSLSTAPSRLNIADQAAGRVAPETARKSLFAYLAEQMSP